MLGVVARLDADAGGEVPMGNRRGGARPRVLFVENRWGGARRRQLVTVTIGERGGRTRLISRAPTSIGP